MILTGCDNYCYYTMKKLYNWKKTLWSVICSKEDFFSTGSGCIRCWNQVCHWTERGVRPWYESRSRRASVGKLQRIVPKVIWDVEKTLMKQALHITLDGTVSSPRLASMPPQLKEKIAMPLTLGAMKVFYRKSFSALTATKVAGDSSMSRCSDGIEIWFLVGQPMTWKYNFCSLKFPLRVTDTNSCWSNWSGEIEGIYGGWRCLIDWELTITLKKNAHFTICSALWANIFRIYPPPVWYNVCSAALVTADLLGNCRTWWSQRVPWSTARSQLEPWYEIVLVRHLMFAQSSRQYLDTWAHCHI